MVDVYWDYEGLEEEWLERYPRDKAVDQAKEELEEFFRANDEDVFYMQQLEVFFEKQFFHWITAKAINELIRQGRLKAEEQPLLGATRVKFVSSKRHRYNKLQIREKLRVVREYSNPVIASGCGRQAEVLFFNALTARGFVCHGQDTNEFGDRKWTATDHDLDFIVERDGTTYGAEVKNKLSYIEEEELEIKLAMCLHLGVKPLFIMRGSPKSYNYRIARTGGYAMIFVAQVYPFGQQELVQRITGTLGLPADCPKAIPEGIIERFARWHSGGKG